MLVGNSVLKCFRGRVSWKFVGFAFRCEVTGQSSCISNLLIRLGSRAGWKKRLEKFKGRQSLGGNNNPWVERGLGICFRGLRIVDVVHPWIGQEAKISFVNTELN